MISTAVLNQRTRTAVVPHRPSSTSSTSSSTSASTSSSTKRGGHVSFAVSSSEIKSPHILYNWSGVNPIAKHSQIYYPTSKKELAQLIRSTHGRVNVVGSGLSYEKIMTTPMNDPSAILVSMKNFVGLRRMTKDTAVFGAATTIDEVIRILGTHDRMMPCSPGVIGVQTLAGSIATGTHGQGLFQSSYADIVTSLRVVLPNGDLVTVGGPNGREDLPLEAFATSIGMLGIVTEVEISHAPRRVFTCTKLTCDITEFLQMYVKWNESIEFVKVWWFPETDQVHVWLTHPADTDSPAYKAFAASDRVRPFEAEVSSSALNDTVLLYCKAMSHDTKAAHDDSSSDTSSRSPSPSPSSTSSPSPSAQTTTPPPPTDLTLPPQFRTVRRFADARDLTGYQEQILTKGIPVPQVNCEIALPLSHFTSATLALRTWSLNNKSRLHYPFIYRATGQSRAWLNPAHSGPVVYVGLLVYLAEDGSIREDGLETMREVQAILARFGGLPHWGKHFGRELYDFPNAYARWGDFAALRQRVDPRGRFLSEFLGGVFGATTERRTARREPLTARL
ncbi:FAD binding domain-containing protein [Fimicolochytrium jonesii]|uniref:FAD binding domain-containing protein n=1 Tax=Fimicolochytrium jonesii TaxID=1396493 RepID=UPI0022FE1871|nr:FAD binding domain-containing protein [Fimicolochytrium jonesii]KAI8821860.1 FAD binding domain-containing protein [Fimicolochytrium jonesii]